MREVKNLPTRPDADQLQELEDLAVRIGNNFALARLHQTMRWVTQGTRPDAVMPARWLDKPEPK